MLAILRGEGFMSVDDAARRRKVARQHHQVTPVPLLTLHDPGTPEFDADVDAVRQAVAAIRRKRTCGAYVYVTPDRRVHVLSEESAMAADWVLACVTYLVGLYCAQTVRLRNAPDGPLGPPVTLGLDQLGEDLAEHLHALPPVPPCNC